MSQRSFNWPALSLTTNPGPLEFTKNGATVTVTQDTTTPGNSIPLPIAPINTSGSAVNPATSDLQTTGNTSLSSIDTKLTGVATAANQSTANTSLSSIDTKLTSQATAANQSTGNTSLASIDTKLTGVATAANQSTANTSLSSIDGKLTGVATSANQSTANTSLSSIDGKLTGVSTAANQSTANTSLSSIDGKLTAKTALAKARNDYTSTNVTTGAYVQLIASVGGTAVKEVEIFDSSGQTLVLATGGAGSEVDQLYIFPGGNGRVPLTIAATTRVAIKAVSATASSGEIDVNFYG